MTTASLHQAMVEALRRVTAKTWPTSEVHKVSRAALEGWEKRPRLRNNEALVRELRFDLPDRDTTLRVLDSVERALHGERG